MNLLSILVEGNAHIVHEKMQHILDSFRNEGIDVEERLTKIDDFYHLNYTISIENVKGYPISDFINIFRYCAANALCDYILLYEEPCFLHKIINEEYYYFDAKEKLEIYRNALEIFKEENEERFFQNSEDKNIRDEISQRLVEYLNTNGEINLNGFILFRLKDYLIELNETVERAVEDFLVDKEYNEFIKLLKYFVDIQEPKINTVHVIFQNSNQYHLYDQHYCPLNNDYMKDIVSELSESEVSYDDLLISSLITIAPRQIYIHKEGSIKKIEVMGTLKKIFGSRLHYCEGCERCGTKMNVKKE